MSGVAPSTYLAPGVVANLETFSLGASRLGCCAYGPPRVDPSTLQPLFSALATKNQNKLKSLVLETCFLGIEDMQHLSLLKDCPSLVTLDLSNNGSIKQEGFDYLREGFNHLVWLSVSNCNKLEDIGCFKNLKSLETLQARNCGSLTTKSFEVFRDEPDSFPSLRVLNISLCEELDFELVASYVWANNHTPSQLVEFTAEKKKKKSLFTSSRKNDDENDDDEDGEEQDDFWAALDELDDE